MIGISSYHAIENSRQMIEHKHSHRYVVTSPRLRYSHLIRGLVPQQLSYVDRIYFICDLTTFLIES